MANILKFESKNKGVRYRVHIRISGYPARCATFAKINDARNWAARIEGDMRSNKYLENSCENMYHAHQMIDRYIQFVLPVKSSKMRYIEGQKQQLLWWRAHIGRYRLSKITHFMLSDMRDKLREAGKKPATINRYMSALNHVLNVARKEWGWITRNPLEMVQKPKEPRGRLRHLSKCESDRLLAQCAKMRIIPLHAIVMLALCTGARKSELLGIKMVDMDLDNRCIAIHDTKNGESRRLTIANDMIFACITSHIATQHQANQTYLFEHPRTNKPYQIEREWNCVRELAGLADVRFHDLRHTFASNMAMNGASLGEIAEALGHKTLNMVKRYAHLSETHTANVVASMCEKFLPSEKILAPQNEVQA